MNSILELAKELVNKLEEKEKQNKVELSTINPGETFKIGEHNFIVLEQCEGQAKVISKDLTVEDVKFDEDIRDYKVSNLKNVIENDILPTIEKEVGADNIVEHEVDLTSVDMQNEFGSCECKVRPITFDEARKYNNLLVNKDLNDWYWTLTPWNTEERGYKYSMAVVSPSGCVISCYCISFSGVRPFCILKSNIFVSKGEN